MLCCISGRRNTCTETSELLRCSSGDRCEVPNFGGVFMHPRGTPAGLIQLWTPYFIGSVKDFHGGAHPQSEPISLMELGITTKCDREETKCH